MQYNVYHMVNMHSEAKYDAISEASSISNDEGCFMMFILVGWMVG